MLVLGLALAALIGLSLGLLGGGGSILTVPVFVYVLGIAAKPAIAMSLPVVGVTSLLSAALHWRLGNVRVRTAIPFGLLAMAGAYAGARMSILMSGTAQLALLAVVMLAAAGSMLRGGEQTVGDLVEATGLGTANVSNHLRLLHGAGFVTRRKEGLYVYYGLAGDDGFRLCDIMCGRLAAEAASRRRVLAGR